MKTCGLDTHHKRLIVIIAMCTATSRAATTRVQSVMGEIAIVCTAPSPVDMEKTVVIVAIANESMTATAMTSFYHRPSSIQFTSKHTDPNGISSIFFIYTVYSAFITKIIFQRILGTSQIRIAVGVGIGTARVDAIIHFYGHTHMEHQSGHSIHLSSCTLRIQSIGHHGPIVGCRTKICGQSSKIVIGVCMRARTRYRPVPELHHLCRRCCRTTCNRMNTSGIGTQVIVIRALVPCSGQHR